MVVFGRSAGTDSSNQRVSGDPENEDLAFRDTGTSTDLASKCDLNNGNADDAVETLQNKTDPQVQKQPRNKIRSSSLPSIPNSLTRPGHKMFTDTHLLEVQSAITCTFCGRCSKTMTKENVMFVHFGDISNLSTPIPLQSLIDTHLQRETIEVDNKSDTFKCPYNCPESQRENTLVEDIVTYDYCTCLKL